MSSLKVKVSEKKSDCGSTYEGTVSISGLKPTKLQKSDGSTSFPTKAAAMSSARSLGKRLNCTVVDESTTSMKKAAKKSTKTTAKKPTPCSETSGCSSGCGGSDKVISPPWLATDVKDK